MPNRTVHCSICGHPISGYNMAERMEKLRHHRKLRHPYAHKESTKRGVAKRKQKRG